MYTVLYVPIELLELFDRCFTDSNSPKRETLRGQPTTVKFINKAEELNAGDHILHQITRHPYRRMYCSALVVKVDKMNERCSFIEVITNSVERGVSKKKIMFDDLHSLHKAKYSRFQYNEEESIDRAEKRLAKDEHHYHPLHNNSHHFVTWCKTGQEHPLTDIVKSLEYIEGELMDIYAELHVMGSVSNFLHRESPSRKRDFEVKPYCV